MKRLIILILLLLMSAVCIQSAFADAIVEKLTEFNIKCYGDGDVSNDGINTTGTSFTFTTADIIARFSIGTGMVFSSRAQLIMQEYYAGNATSTTPTKPYLLKIIIRDGINDTDASDYVDYKPMTTEAGKVYFVEGKDGSFTLYSAMYCAIKNINNGESLGIFGFVTDTGKLIKPPYAFVMLGNATIDAIGTFSQMDVNGKVIPYICKGTVKYTNAQIVSVF